MAPVTRGVEIVPRPGRIHVMDFPIVALSEVEGTITFQGGKGGRGVSGLRLQLIDKKDEIVGATRTERGGYYFIEQIMPGKFKLRIDPEQAKNLGICMADNPDITVAPTGDIYTVNADVQECA